VAGAKWQAERMYSEEEVLEIIRQYALEEHLITSSKPDIWFKQYKKK
jgi:HEPN domain-containing protein